MGGPVATQTPLLHLVGLEEEEVVLDPAPRAAAEEGIPVELVQPIVRAAAVEVRFQQEPRSLVQPTPDKVMSSLLLSNLRLK